MRSKTTFVTALWDIGRHNLTNGFERNFDEYVGFLKQFVKETEIPVYLYTSPDIARQLGSINNVYMHLMSLDELRRRFEFVNEIEQIRTSFNWKNQADWLRESPQAQLGDYNVITFSKYFLLNDVTYTNPFNSQYFYWIDAGIARTLPLHYVRDAVISKIEQVYDVDSRVLMLSYPYTGNNEIHGFAREAINEYAETKEVKYVCRGGFFGGSKHAINKLNGTYWHYLSTTLKDGYMGTEESIFTILSYSHTQYITRHDIGDSGLIYNFFEYIKTTKSDTNKQSLYVLSYNAPKQFKKLISTFTQSDQDFLLKPKKYLINNSNDTSTDEEYNEICRDYGFEQIKFNNIGINGGRQFVAEHFDRSDSDYYVFFEDDMGLNTNLSQSYDVMDRSVMHLYKRSLQIMKIEKFDYLKLTFNEFYGTNSTQFAWYNIPQHVRDKEFPNNRTLPVSGLSPNPPLTQFTAIKAYDELPYAIGQVYYCNWPLWFSRDGNRKVFLDDKFAKPYEQTWMSRCFSLHLENVLRTGVLLTSAIVHDRFDHYTGERLEN